MYHGGLLEGKPMDNVDSNMNFLRERIQLVKMKERLMRCKEESTRAGWCYPSAYDVQNMKRNASLSDELMQFTGLTVGAFALSLAGCTICLCLFSLLIHLSN